MVADLESPLRPPLLAVRGQAVRFPRWSRRRWIASLLAVAVCAAGAGYVADVSAAPPITMGNGYGWLYPEDSLVQVNVSASGASQTTVPIRSGKEQGLVIDVWNPSGYTQTIVGLAANFNAPGAGDSRARLEVSTTGTVATVSDSTHLSYLSSGAIPPHGVRSIRLTWTSRACMDLAGATSGIDSLPLRVRVGWFTRTEVIRLPAEFAVSGPSTPPFSENGPCNG
jgi:hypothetical protein